jgi:CheY-like chemotaxis protein
MSKIEQSGNEQECDTHLKSLLGFPGEGCEMPGAKIRLLIVDDEPSTRTLLSQIFTNLGHHVRSAEDGFSALVEIRYEMPDIILSDLNMPGMSGFELLSVIRRRFPSMRAIAMSGAFSGDSVQPGVAADAFHEKATGLDSLLQIVETMAQPEWVSSPFHPRTLAPVWIPKNGHDPAGEAFVTISCPECLRTFPRVHGEDIGPIHKTNCTHCGNLIHYAIIPPIGAAFPHPFQRKPAAATPTHLSLPASNLESDAKERLHQG